MFQKLKLYKNYWFMTELELNNAKKTEMNWSILVQVISHVISEMASEASTLPTTSQSTTTASSDAPPPLVPQKFEFLAYSIVQVSMSSSTECDAVSMSSQLDTYVAEVQAMGTLCVNALEFWHPRGPSGLAWLAKDLICAPASQAYVERIFSVCGLLCSGQWSAMFWSIEMRACLKLWACWKKPLIHRNHFLETWC